MILSNSRFYLGKQVGDYKLESIVGEGKYGVCYLASTVDNNQVIVKKFKPSVFNKNKHKNAYEAIMLSQIKDSRIPEFLGVINEKGFYAFVLEYKAGKTLNRLIFDEGYQFSMEQCYQIMKKLISIIHYLHQNSIVHRDIRIHNVIIDFDDVYLIDFGLARWEENPDYSKTQDFAYLADLLLYLLYSCPLPNEQQKTKVWYRELPLSESQIKFIKKLFGMEVPYFKIEDVERDFIMAFEQEA